MEEILECYFVNVFGAMGRGDLFARYKRRQVIDYFVRVVTGCTQAGVCDTNTGYQHAVSACLRHHSASKATNGGICLLGKHHSLLYIAAKLAYDGRIGDEGGGGDLVAALLQDIFHCEGSFEKLIIGAIFGSKAASLMIGWTSEFDSREENVLALEYFLEHATRHKLLFPVKNHDLRLADLPMVTYGLSTPLRSTVLLNKADVLRVLLRYGVTLDTDDDGYVPAINFIVDGLYESFRVRGPITWYPDTVECVTLLFRTVSSAKLRVLCDEEERGSPQVAKFLAAHPFIPAGRCGRQPVALKHLCRVRVREMLGRNWQLPAGIYRLNVPLEVQDYLDLGQN